MPWWRCGGRCLAERRFESAWAIVAALMCLGALAARPFDSTLIDWQPSLGWREPWRAWTAVFVHYSGLHLAANVAGAVLVGALGHVAHLPARSVAAWLLAWPLTQFALAIQPELLHYGGLSGVLHAGVAVVAVHLLSVGDTRQRRVGAAMLVVLLAKVLGESPWSGPLRHPAGWDIAVAPLAHASGAAMGAVCALVAEVLAKRTRT